MLIQLQTYGPTMDLQEHIAVKFESKYNIFNKKKWNKLENIVCEMVEGSYFEMITMYDVIAVIHFAERFSSCHTNPCEYFSNNLLQR